MRAPILLLLVSSHLLTLCLARNAQGEPKHIQIVGVPDKPFFADSSKSIWDSLKSRGYSNELIIGSPSTISEIGDWTHADGNRTSITTKNALLLKIKTDLKKVTPGDGALLYVGNQGLSLNGRYGGRFDRAGDPDNTGFILLDRTASGFPYRPLLSDIDASRRRRTEGKRTPRSSYVPWPELLEAARNALPESSSLKIVSGASYSGGAHKSVSKMRNACALTAVDYQGVAWIPMRSELQEKTGAVEQSFSEQVKNPKFDPDASGRTSLMEAFFYCQENDFSGAGFRVSISSFDYVDSILKEGAYHPNHDFTKTQSRWTYDDELSSVVRLLNPSSDIVNNNLPGHINAVIKHMKSYDDPALLSDIPVELRRIYSAAVPEKGPGPLPNLKRGDIEFKNKFSVERLERLKQQWVDANDTEKRAEAKRRLERLLAAPGAQEIMSASDDYEKQLVTVESMRAEVRIAKAYLADAWLFKSKEAAALESAKLNLDSEQRKLDKIEADRRALASKYPGLLEAIQGAQAAGNSNKDEIYQNLKKAYKDLEQEFRGNLLSIAAARAGVLRERMLRVSKFMRTASREQIDVYLRLLKCELEDI